VKLQQTKIKLFKALISDTHSVLQVCLVM